MEETETKTKFCKYCGQKIPEDAVMCTHCGRQVETLKSEQPNIVINNSNTNVNTNTNAGYGSAKTKWVALLLCFFLGFLGAHKFYEGKILLGIVYFISLLFKPNPYIV